MKPKYFLIACFLVAAVLFKYGVPVPALIAGIVLAGVWTLYMQRKTHQKAPPSR